MLLRNHIFVFFIATLWLMSVGCQGGSNPVAPNQANMNDQTASSGITGRQSTDFRGGHQLLALVECEINVEENTVDVRPMRTALSHLNLLQLIPMYCKPVTKCLDFINLVIHEPTATCDLDVVVTHPIPDPYADVFDMRGIGIFIGTLDAGFTDGKIATQILNAYGYTTAYDQGGLYDAFLNPYVAFNQSIPKRKFANKTTTSEHITCKFPSLVPPNTKFLYALDATWSDPLSYDPGNLLTDPNMAEPYKVEMLYSDPIKNTSPSQGTLVVEVKDWQKNAKGVEVEAPALFGGSLNMTEVSMVNGRYIYYMNLINDEGAASGTYPMLLKALDEFGSQPDLVNPNIIVELANYQLEYVTVYNSALNTAPVASIVADDLVVVLGTPIHFDATGSYDAEDGTVNNYAWDLNGDFVFNDGSMPSFDHVYGAIGKFCVNVKITDSGGLTDILDMPLEVYVMPSSNTPPVASAFASNYTPFQGQEITLDASASTDLEDTKPISWQWDLDNDGAYDDASGEVIKTSWSTIGNKLVDVFVKDSGGLGDVLNTKLSINVQISGNSPPTAVAVASTLSAYVGEEITFDGSLSSDPEDGSVTQYHWDLLGNKTYSDGATAIVKYAYQSPGAYEVDLKVVDSDALVDYLDAPLIVNIYSSTNQTPIVIATSDKNIVQMFENVYFDASDSYDPEGGDITFAWDLNGDGNYTEAFVPDLYWWYDTPGTYNVNVRVCDTLLACGYLPTPIVIEVQESQNSQPVAAATADKYVIIEGDIVYFDASPSTDPEDGTPVSYHWELDGDGLYDDSDFIATSKQFNVSGTYYIDVKVFDSKGAWDTLNIPLEIKVLPPGSNFPPLAVGDVNCTLPFVNQVIRFTDDSYDQDAGSIVKWEWNFGDGAGWKDFTSQQGDVDYFYSKTGVFFADLRVTDNDGAKDTLNAMISIIVSNPSFNTNPDPPTCASLGTHMFGASIPLPEPNTSINSRDIAFIPGNYFIMVISGKLKAVTPPSMPVEPPLLNNANWIQSIDASNTGLVALSGLDDGIIHLYQADTWDGVTFTPAGSINAGQPISAVTIDNSNNIWVYTSGEIRQYVAPTFSLNPCRVYNASVAEAMGDVDDMVFSVWNHSIYLAINDGANGIVLEYTYLGNQGAIANNVLAGPSRYMDIVIDNNVKLDASTGCRIEVLGGINKAYVTRLNADLEVLNTSQFGYFGIRGAALDLGPTNVIMAIEDCCLSWMDMFIPPSDWTDTGD